LLISGIFRVLIAGIGRNPEGNAGDADDLSLNFPPRAYGRGTFFEGLSGQELALGAWRGPDGQQLERRHRRRRRRPQTVVVLYPRAWRRSSDRRGSPRCGLEWILRFGLGSKKYFSSVISFFLEDELKDGTTCPFLVFGLAPVVLVAPGWTVLVAADWADLGADGGPAAVAAEGLFGMDFFLVPSELA